ncbi:hypothetical protein MKX01_038836 [Papaver californicum]|nr:hypothetical protein MKX01_038836 [Papaver californicum]
MTGFGSPCGACKFLRRKCLRGCVFAPYFCHEQGAIHFAAIHKVFGASNVSKLLTHLPLGDRCEAAVTISYEAQARIQDPVYGCVSHIFALQQQVVSLQAEITTLRAQQAAQGFVNGGNITTSTNDHIHQQGNHSNKLFYGDFLTTYPQDHIQALNMQLDESKILWEQLYQNNATSMNDSISAITDDENMFYYENEVVNASNQMSQEYHDHEPSTVPPEETIHQFMTSASLDEQQYIYSSDEHHQHAAMASLYLDDMQMNNARKWTFQDTDQVDLLCIS